MSTRTPAQQELNFTKEQGIAVQKQQLAEWKLLLKLDAFLILESFVTADNDKASDGFDICRGNAMNDILSNEVLPLMQLAYTPKIK